MTILQTQGIHHITLNGADRQTSIDFWDGILGMALTFEQPNLDAPDINHLYFDCGDGRLLTVFSNESRKPSSAALPQPHGSVHHLAFTVAQSTLRVAQNRLKSAGIASTEIKDRGFMDSIYFRDPLGLLVEIASYKFEPPIGHTHAQVLAKAHQIRIENGSYALDDAAITEALIAITGT